MKSIPSDRLTTPRRRTRFWATGRTLFATTLVLALLGLATLAYSGRIGAQVNPHKAIGEVIAESDDAYIAFDQANQIWEIGTDAIRRRMQFKQGVGYKLIALTNLATGREWVSPDADANAEFQLTIGGRKTSGADPRFTLGGWRATANPDGSLELQVALVCAEFSVQIYYVAYPRTSALEQWVRVRNVSTQALPGLSTVDLVVLALKPSPEPLVLHWVQGLSPQPEQDVPVQPLPTLRKRSTSLDEGVTQELGSSPRSSDTDIGWYVLAAPELGEGLYGGIEWSGAWLVRVQRENGTTLINGAIQNIDRSLHPGDAIDSPRRFIGFYQGDLNDAANRTRDLTRAYLSRPLPGDFPWTQYNTWYSFGIGYDEGSLREQVDAAAELGLEAFYVDAGWYEGSPSEGDFGWGLGTWRENRIKFPSGLAAFSDYVHSKGLKFGLWVEPERIDMRYAGEGNEIPLAWLAPTAGVEPPYQDEATTAQVCLGDPQAREWMKAWLSRLIEDYRLDWLKWDYNIWMSCDPPGQNGEGNYAHIQGLYEVLDYIRSRFPALVVENCAGGSNRTDYGLMRRTDVAWLSDETEPSYRVRYYMAGASYPFPPEYLNAWLIDSPLEPIDTLTSAGALRGWQRSRMTGAFGISANIAAWTPEVRSVVASQIELYKRIRHLIAGGYPYRLTPQTLLTVPDLEPPASPDAVEYVDTGGSEGVIFLFRVHESEETLLTVRGLRPDINYQVTSTDEAIVIKRTGRQLMTEGFVAPGEPGEPSALYFIEPAP